MRESIHSFVGEKYGLYEENDIKFIQNEMKRRRVKIYEWGRKCNCKVESSGDIKRQKGREKVGKNVLVGVN